METFIRDAQGREDVYRFKQVLKQVAKQVEASEGGKQEAKVIPIGRKLNRKWLSLAASLLLAVGAMWLFLDRPLNEQQLAMNALENPHFEFSRSGSDNVNDSKKKELQDLVLKNDLNGFLAASLIALADTSFTKAEGNWVKLYRAYAFLNENKVEAARAELGTLEEPNPSELAQRSYYLAIADLQENDKDAAISTLKEADAQFPWDERMESLLKEIEQ
jgi:hypothetical protein